MNTTDWDHYYRQPYKLNTFLKRIVTRRIIRYLNRTMKPAHQFSLIEFGGGNSCFYIPFEQNFRPSIYNVIDNNPLGLQHLEQRVPHSSSLKLIQQDIMSFDQPQPQLFSDVVFSVGLIEHFSVEDTRRAIIAHLNVLKPGGILILGFPTPTLLYRFARKISEAMNQWIFHDERPLKINEVLETLNPYCEVLESHIIYSIIFTQAFVIARKKE